jgi:hypothetical protein
MFLNKSCTFGLLEMEFFPIKIQWLLLRVLKVIKREPDPSGFYEKCSTVAFLASFFKPESNDF